MAKIKQPTEKRGHIKIKKKTSQGQSPMSRAKKGKQKRKLNVGQG